MRFGWLTLSHSPSAADDYTAIEEQLTQACLAEQVGFDSVWLTEHNFTGEAVYCDPIPFASALAARTTRVRIGFAVIQLALRHPIRLAVQLALLDNLSRGRLDVGVGRGTLYNEYEYVGYGLRSDDSRERSAEALEILTRAWTEEPFAYQGKFFQVSLPALRPRVYQRPHPPIWRSVVTPGSFAECGRQGVPILTSRLPLGVLGERLKLYEDGLVAGGHSALVRDRLRRDVAVWRHVYVGESHAEAEDRLADTLAHTRRHMLDSRAAHNPADYRVDPLRHRPAGRRADRRATERRGAAHPLPDELRLPGPRAHRGIDAPLRRPGHARLPLRLCLVSVRAPALPAQPMFGGGSEGAVEAPSDD